MLIQVLSEPGQGDTETKRLLFNKLLYHDYLLGSLPLSSQQFLPPIAWFVLFAVAVWLRSPPSFSAGSPATPSIFQSSHKSSTMVLPFADSAFCSKQFW